MYKITSKFLRVPKWRKVILLLTVLCTLNGFSQEYITNGDMESSGGWKINHYNLASTSGTSNPKEYAVVSSARDFNNAFGDLKDHSGNGKMLVFDSTLDGGQQHFWQAGNNGSGVCALSTTTTHTFSYWIRTISSGARADIGVQFTNVTNLTLTKGATLAPDINSGWQQVVYTFTPTNNCVFLVLKNTNSNNLADGSGNDFAIDDISLTAPPPPLTIDYYSNIASCPNNSDASIEAYKFGGVGPFTYTLSGAASQTNATGIFTGLAPGNYTVQVQGSTAEFAVTPTISLQAPIDITTSPNVTICEGTSTSLTASGSSGVYNWSASPADASITNPSLANQNVQPSVTTIYTVTSTVVTNSSGPSNLLQNSSFAAGNTGFTSDYEFLDGANPAKKQKAYGIVPNPKVWEEDFTTCGDRSSSNDGLMMVVDGAITAGNNDKVWSQTVNGLKPNTFYIFSYWVQSVAALNPAKLETKINGAIVGTDDAPSSACGWIRKFYKWNTGASTSAIIDIIDRNVILAGNDFALDEMSFAEAVLCDLQKQVTVTVTPKKVATFSFPTTINEGDVAPLLTTTSSNGLTGTWSPLVVDNTKTGTYTFTPTDASQCGSGSVDTIVVVKKITNTDPTFTLPATICRGTVVPLPTSSTNAPTPITGTWNPSTVDNTTTGTYIFTPTAGQNANEFSYSLTVTQPAVLTFPAVKTTYCIGDTPDALPTANGGITGTWSAASISTATAGIVNYLFTPTAGQCVNAFILPVTVNAPTAPTFNGMPSNSACQNQAVGALPTVSAEGITGTWLPAIDTAVTGLTNYTFTPNAGQCATTATFGITVSAPTTPTFVGMPNAIVCQTDVVNAFPTNSVEGITGTWSPVLDMSVIGLTNYTFTPNAGQCASIASFGLTVNAPTAPTFNGMPSNSACQNQAVGALPTVSAEGITGTWSPAIDTAVTGLTTYTFTPNAGQCATTAIFGITVSAPTTPTFTGITPVMIFCQNDAAPVLPTTSVENITGTWSAVITTTTAGNTLYTFTPDAGQCALGTSTNVTVNAPTVPSFSGLSSSVCQGDLAFSLPTTSENGVTGTWSPAFDVNTASSQLYTFTPTAGLCASSASLTITINPRITPSFSGLSSSVCQGDLTFSLPTTSENGVTGTWSPAFDVNTASSQLYTFTPTAGLCALSASLTITINPTIGAIAIVGDCVNTDYILTASPVSGSFDPSTVTYEWTNAATNGVVGTNAATLNASTLSLSLTTFPATINLTVTNTFGCSKTQSFVVESTFCTIPKGVSPNGGNPTFDLTGLNPKKVEIFNRYGVKVFEKENYTNQWGGQTNNGDELPAATYYYVVELKNGQVESGWVYLTR